jgi:hypothetical protein
MNQNKTGGNPVMVTHPAAQSAPAPAAKPGLVAKTVDLLKSGTEVLLAAAVVFVFLTAGWMWALVGTVAAAVLLWKVALGAVIAFMAMMLQKHRDWYVALVIKGWKMLVAWIKSLLNKKTTV